MEDTVQNTRDSSYHRSHVAEHREKHGGPGVVQDRWHGREAAFQPLHVPLHNKHDFPFLSRESKSSHLLLRQEQLRALSNRGQTSGNPLNGLDDLLGSLKRVKHGPNSVVFLMLRNAKTNC